MGVLEIGQKLVEMTSRGREGEEAFVAEYYADGIISIEGGEGSEEMPAKLEGIDAIKGKHTWWYSNNDVHGTTAFGPYVGHRDDQFVVRFHLDITPDGGERMHMEEVGLFTVKDDKIVREEFLYLME